MNATNYKQYDTRWSKLPYKDSPDNIGNNGCGEVAVCNSIIEMTAQMNQTPATMQPYCRQYACHDGTYWSGIPKMLEHYGCTEVMEHQNMSSLWNELAKGGRVAIYMMNNHPAGYLKKKWTSGGHFICSVLYRYNSQNGEHEVYIKDSNSPSSERNGWMSYESSLRGDVSACWSGKLSGSPAPTPTPTPTPKRTLVVDGVGGYETVMRLQEFFNLPDPDGYIGGQYATQQKYRPALTAVKNGRGGSVTVTALQKWCNLSDPDGYWGGNTSKGLQKKLRDLGYLAKDEPLDNICGKKTMSALQECLNNDGKPKTEPTPTPTPPTPTPTKDTKMIDVSDFQSNIDWAKVKADGVKAVIVRCGGRGGEAGVIYDDSDFMYNIKGAYAAGLSVGIYFLTQAINAAEGKEEAQRAIKRWAESGIPISYPICIDSEDVSWKNPDGTTGYGRANSDKLSKAKRTEAIKAFADECKRQGYTSMIYASTSWLYNQVDMSVLSPLMDVWCAQWSSSCTYTGKYIIWQYSSKGSVSGIKGDVDMDWCYVEPKKMNPPSPSPSPDPKPYSGAYPTEAEIRTASNRGIHNNICTWCYDIYKSGKYGYITFEEETQCPLCHPRTNHLGWQCIGYDFAAWRHGGGIPCNCWYGVLYNSLGDNYYYMSNVEILKSLQSRIGVNDIQLIRHDNNPISASELEKGDLLMFYDGKIFSHMGVYIGNGKISDAANKAEGIRYGTPYSEFKCLIAIRYTGTRSYLTKGDEGKAVTDLQNYLNWYTDGAFFKECGAADGVYGNNTLKYVKQMQTDFFGASEADGTVGAKTIAKMKEVKK